MCNSVTKTLQLDCDFSGLKAHSRLRRSFHMKLRILAAGLIFGLFAKAAESGMELYQRAVTQERAGKMDEAIKLYEKVAHDFAPDRALAAKALVQAARGYEKLGQDKAVKLYEQVTREYGDQRELAATARARLAAVRQVPAPTTLTQRKVEDVRDRFAWQRAENRTDGQKTIDYDDMAGGLVISDAAGKNKRLVFKAAATDLLEWAPSRDFSSVLLVLNAKDNRPPGFAVIKSDGTGYREIGQSSLFPPAAVDWSWDNRSVLISDWQERMAIVSVSDGGVREIRQGNSLSLTARFSPDGRFIAYAEGAPGGSKLFLLPVQGGEPRMVADGAALLDWTRDGRFVAITNVRSGSRALSLLPVMEGTAAGEPLFVRYGAFESGRTLPGGAMIYTSVRPTDTPTASLGIFDGNGRVSSWKPLQVGSGQSGNVQMDWTPDGSSVFYVEANDAAGLPGSTIRILNPASGQERELYRSSDAGMLSCASAHQRPVLICVLQSQPAQVLSVALDSGHVEPLATFPGVGLLLNVSADDRSVYLLRRGQFIRKNIVTGEELLLDGPVSPAERWVVQRSAGDVNDPEVRPLSGGDWKRFSIRAMGNLAFTPNENWMVYHAVDNAGKHGLYRVSTSGGQPERLGDLPSSQPSSLKISPDGKQIIVQHAQAFSRELWLMENFVPASR
jgi:hypothetical protein